MKRAQLIVLGIAIAAGAGAMMLMSGDPPPPPPQPQIVAEPARVAMTPVLVAAVDIPMGQRLGANDLRWQDWPSDSVPRGLVTRDQGMEVAEGAISRASFLAGEPIRTERLIQSDGGGFMSAVLPSGKRAVAISIDSRGSSTAGGFILPNDRVDLIHTYRSEAGGTGEVTIADTILRNIRVLAIGKNVQTDEQGNSFVDGETATLELSPSQSETVVRAQRTGQISLVLRSLEDQNPSEDDEIVDEENDSLIVVRHGITRISQ